MCKILWKFLGFDDEFGASSLLGERDDSKYCSNNNRIDAKELQLQSSTRC
jgi:hypothetical protein